MYILLWQKNFATLLLAFWLAYNIKKMWEISILEYEEAGCQNCCGLCNFTELSSCCLLNILPPLLHWGYSVHVCMHMGIFNWLFHLLNYSEIWKLLSISKQTVGIISGTYLGVWRLQCWAKYTRKPRLVFQHFCFYLRLTIRD